jgi:RNA polymerase sigma factor (sigma-70 family)
MISTVRDDPHVLALVERANGGDQAAWDEIVERYAPLVWSVCRRFRLGLADVEDVSGSVWLRLVERLGAIREPAALPGWLVTTTRNECLHRLRRQGRDVPVENDDALGPALGPAADDWLLAHERRAALRLAFADLSEPCRQLLGLLFGDPPAPYDVISATTGMAMGSIGPTRRRCLDRIRAHPQLAALARDDATTGT